MTGRARCHSLAGSLAILLGLLGAAPPEGPPASSLFARPNLIAWCIVPFDSAKRGPEDRAAMLRRLGFEHFAYDWRGEHIPTFEAEVAALKSNKVGLDAWWVAPGELNKESRLILDVLRRTGTKATLWVLLDLGPDKATGAEQDRRVEAASAKLGPLAEAAKGAGCKLALYNHGGWFGEPENQLAIVESLRSKGVTNVGIVYNLHHGHDHLDRFAEVLAKLRPHLVALNLNGMDPGGDKVGRKILPIGQGSLDLQLLRTIRDSGYRGPIGILGHTQDDAEQRLRDNLDGLDWLVPQLDGKPAGPRPVPRTPVPPPPAARAEVPEFGPAVVVQILADAREHGDPARGAEVFALATTGCLTCHKVGAQGGAVGPDLSAVGKCLTAEAVVESIYWPKRQVKEGYAALAVALKDGTVVQGYRQAETADALTLRESATGTTVRLEKGRIDEARDLGTLMPDGLLASLSGPQRRDLVRFLIDLGRVDGVASAFAGHAHGLAAPSFPHDRAPIEPEHSPSWRAPVNRDRVYDWYAKEADAFRARSPMPPLLPAFPGMDGGKFGHWGNQEESTWADDRWNRADLGVLLSGVFRGPGGVVVPKGVCVRLGDRGEVSACFNPETLTYDAAWTGGFVRTSAVRHGFMDGLIPVGEPLPRPEGSKPAGPIVYRGFYRHENRIVFAYKVGEVEMLDAPWAEGGKFTRVVGPADSHPMRDKIKGGGRSRWPQVIETRGTLGNGRPYAVDTVTLPFDNPWNAPLFVGDHDFTDDGTAYLCTIQGDVWRVDGLDDSLARPRWKRFAGGLHQALGLVVVDGLPHVLGRDQITRLRDLDGDGEADVHECVSNAYKTSPNGHDFICGLQRDAAGNYFTASGPDGVLKIGPDGRSVAVIATGFRNPDGLGLGPDGTITVPSSEGEWVPASNVSEVRPGGHYGAGGPRGGKVPDLPLCYLPRGLDNSSGGQVTVPDDRWGPLKGQLVHLSFGSGNHFLVLRDRVGDQPQGAVVPLRGEFRSGAHRARFNPKDGQLWVSGSAGWGSYTVDDGSFQRVRYTGDPVQIPVAWSARENGVLVTFSGPVDPSTVGSPASAFAQAWNYRYGPGYGSPEMSSRHPGTVGHDPMPIRSATVLADGRSVFYEIPDLRPVNVLHLRLRVDAGAPHDLFATVHRLAGPFTAIPGYRPVPRVEHPHPIVADLALVAKTTPNPWKGRLSGAREIKVEAGRNLTFLPSSFSVKAGEPIKLTFLNPDAVPHNWALLRPGTLATVGDLANRLVADPDAAARHYIPRSDAVLVHTDVVNPLDQFSISFRAPDRKGTYPFLCTFPGHWMVMNGVMVVGD